MRLLYKIFRSRTRNLLDSGYIELPELSEGEVDSRVESAVSDAYVFALLQQNYGGGHKVFFTLDYAPGEPREESAIIMPRAKIYGFSKDDGQIHTAKRIDVPDTLASGYCGQKLELFCISRIFLVQECDECRNEGKSIFINDDQDVKYSRSNRDRVSFGW